MAAAEGTTMTVQAMGRMLGLKKTESYYLLHKHHFATVTINHQLRVVRASFEQWYAHQDKYRKVDGPEPGAMLQTQFYCVSPRLWLAFNRHSTILYVEPLFSLFHLYMISSRRPPHMRKAENNGFSNGSGRNLQNY